MKTKKLKISSIEEAPFNYNLHPDNQLDQLKKSLEEFGQFKNIVVWNGYCIAGNGLTLAAAALGWEHIQAVVLDALTEEQAKRLCVADNATPYLAAPDSQRLEDLLRSVSVEDIPGVDDSWLKTMDLSLDMFLGEDGDGGEDFVETEEDEGPPDDCEERVSRGDIWRCGDHVLLCGDSCVEDNVRKVLGGKRIDMIFTDPPYGVSYSDKNAMLNKIDKGNRVQRKIANDHMTSEETAKLWSASLCLAKKNMAEYSCFYVTAPQGGELLSLILSAMISAGMLARHILVWAKNNHVLGRCDYNYKHEPILYGWPHKHKFYGGGEQKTSVWEYPKPQKSELHPTMKPVQLIANAILNSTIPDMIVYDPFGGSGSTMIACEQTGRCAAWSSLRRITAMLSWLAGSSLQATSRPCKIGFSVI